MSNTNATPVTTPAVSLRKSTEVITEAHSKVTVTGTERARALRTAAEIAVTNEYGPFTIVETVSLPKGEAFRTWVAGSVGRNGFKVRGKMGVAIMGRTTIEAMISHDPKSFTNAAAYGLATAKAGARGKVVMSGLIEG